MLQNEGTPVESAPLLRRIAVLESRLRMMQWLVALALIVPPLVAMANKPVKGDASHPLKTIETHQLVIKDELGRTRIVLGAPKAGVGGGSHEGPQAWQEGPSPEITLLDQQKRPRARIAVAADGEPSFTLVAAEGHPILELRALPSPGLVLNSAHRNLVTLEAFPNAASFTMFGPTTGDQITVETRTDSSMGLRLYRGGSLRAALGDIDPATAARWQVSERPTSSLLLLDGQSQTVFAAPPPLGAATR